MKRPWLILVTGLALALCAYCLAYVAGRERDMPRTGGSAPELAWLQKEFQLPDHEFDRVANLHATYVAGCAERCRQIDAKNAELRSLLTRSETVTPEIERTLQESAQLRAECQKVMLEHFYEISRSMPPDQGKRYFEWVVGRTFGSEHASMTSSPDAAPHEHLHQ